MAANVRLPSRRVGVAFALALAACSSNDDQEAGGATQPRQEDTGVCDAHATFGEPIPLDVTSEPSVRFGSITPDELSIAWLVPGADEGTATVFYADRSSSEEPFGPARELAASDGFFALDSAALGPDGLSLLVVRIDHYGFAVATRESRSDDFGELGLGAYSNLNPNLNDLHPNESEIGDPVIAPDDLAFVYSEYAEGFEDTVRIATRNAPLDSYTSTIYFLTPELRPEGSLRRRPSGLSSDYLALFYWDEVDEIQKVAFRSRPTSEFDLFVELGQRRFAQPNESCTRLYFEDDGSLVFAEAN